MEIAAAENLEFMNIQWKQFLSLSALYGFIIIGWMLMKIINPNF